MHNKLSDHSTSSHLEIGDCVADSQFDYPFSESGWHYQTLDQQNRFGHWQERTESAQSATPMAFLVCEDPHCLIGRDFVHPGHTHRPSMQWNADRAGAYQIEGEFSLFRPTASGNIVMQLYIDDVLEVAETLSFPDTLKFSVACHLEAGSFVRLIISNAGVINNNHCLFYARINRLMAGHELELMSRTIEKKRPKSWGVLDRVLRSSLGYEIPTRSLAALSHRLFADVTQPSAANASAARAIHSAHFAHHNQNFRLPRTFKIHRIEDSVPPVSVAPPATEHVVESFEATIPATPQPTSAEPPGADLQVTTEICGINLPHRPLDETQYRPITIGGDQTHSEETSAVGIFMTSADAATIEMGIKQTYDLPFNSRPPQGPEAEQQNA